MSNNNTIYKCKVNGVVGRQGKYTAMCPKIKVGILVYVVSLEGVIGT